MTDLNWDGYVGTNVPNYNWTYNSSSDAELNPWVRIESSDAELNPWERIEYGVLTDLQRNEVIAISIREARNILKEFFEEITDENLKVDVDALQEYIDSFMKKAT